LPFLAITEDIIIEELKKENQRLKGQYEKDFRAKDEEIKNLKAKMDNEIKLLKEENRLTRKLVKDLIKNI
jgi:esterase/lipase